MNGLRLDTLPPMRSFIDRGGQWVAGQVALFAAWAVALATFRVSLPVWVVVTGAVLGLVGSALGLAGLRGLGPSLTPYPEPRSGAQLVETGVYGLVRHPIYGGIGIAGTGLGLLVGSIPAAIIGLVLLGFFRVKAAGEERRLVAAWPEYATYRRRVRAALVPWLL